MTDTSIEIACTLTEPELRRRKDILREKLSPFLVDASYAAGSSQLVFSKAHVSIELLTEMISLERECCPFFTFDLTESSSNFHIDVTGPQGSETLVRDFFSRDIDQVCGCAGPNKPNIDEKKFVFGFITLCAIACAVPSILAAFGLISLATGAYVGMWIEGAMVFALALGSVYLFLQFVKKRQRKVSS